MYEVIINEKTVLATTNRQQACSLFDFYRANKKLFNIDEIVLMNPEEEFFIAF